jgi:hypothetical protein
VASSGVSHQTFGVTSGVGPRETLQIQSDIKNLPLKNGLRRPFCLHFSIYRLGSANPGAAKFYWLKTRAGDWI